MESPWYSQAHGALIIDKPAGISSFGVIDHLSKQLHDVWGVKRREQPKMGHGGTLDPFATGVLIVCVGNAVKLARYFLGATKSYEGTMRFGATTASGDLTDPVTETSLVRPQSIEQLRLEALKMKGESYLQLPPMHSAKKKNGVPLYELARQGIEVERAPKLCTLFDFGFERFDVLTGQANYQVTCSSGTYVRTLSQDFARRLGTLAYLESLRRTQAGAFTLAQSITLPELDEWVATTKKPWTECRGWMDFNRLLGGYFHVEATADESTGLQNGQQQWLMPIVERALALRAAPSALSATPEVIQGQEDFLAIECENRLIAVAHLDSTGWGLERVFTRD